MSLPEEIMVEIQAMNDMQKREALDLARFIRQKDARELDMLMDSIINENMEAFEELAK